MNAAKDVRFAVRQLVSASAHVGIGFLGEDRHRVGSVNRLEWAGRHIRKFNGIQQLGLVRIFLPYEVVLDYLLLLTVDPAGDDNEEKLPRL